MQRNTSAGSEIDQQQNTLVDNLGPAIERLVKHFDYISQFPLLFMLIIKDD